VVDPGLGDHRPFAKAALGVLAGPLKSWDRRAALGADRYLVVSNAVRRHVQDAYGIDAEVLPPPVAFDVTGEIRTVPGVERGFFLLVSRLLPYKNVNIALEAFRKLPKQRLVVVGTGPEQESLSREAPPNVLFLGTVTDDQLRWLYQEATAIVAPSFEDFGLTPVEGALAGKPTIALRAGGYLDTVEEGTTGVFFDVATPEALLNAVVETLSCQWDEDRIRDHAHLFSEECFAKRLHEVVSEELAAAPFIAKPEVVEPPLVLLVPPSGTFASSRSSP
jgi:glycosyltransferase involved in cell wall biosynthesis